MAKTENQVKENWSCKGRSQYKVLMEIGLNETAQQEDSLIKNQ